MAAAGGPKTTGGGENARAATGSCCPHREQSRSPGSATFRQYGQVTVSGTGHHARSAVTAAFRAVRPPASVVRPPSASTTLANSLRTRPESRS